MNTKEHKKHSDIAKPSHGTFGWNEWAVTGTQCNNIKTLANVIIKSLSPLYNCAYVDAKHTDELENSMLPQHLESGAVISYTQHTSYHQLDFRSEMNDFQRRQLFNNADIVLINGNHFTAKSQIVVIDENKRDSLKKRLPQLTNVELILLGDDAEDIFDFIKDRPSFTKIPVYKLSDTSTIIDFFRTKLEQSKPLLNGLVLAGGKSIRMGFDKGSIAWHGKEQQYYLAGLLKSLCNDVFISCRQGQEKEIDNNYKALPDTFTNLGPYGAILSAFREKPDDAWLVVACDLPLLDSQTLQYLKDNRNVASMATAFERPYNHFPEPLITIWEPKSYPVLLSFLAQGYNCPRKAIQNMDTNILKIQHPETLTNVNTPADFEKVQQLLHEKLQSDVK